MAQQSPKNNPTRRGPNHPFAGARLALATAAIASVIMGAQMFVTADLTTSASSTNTSTVASISQTTQTTTFGRQSNIFQTSTQPIPSSRSSR
ncbi:MAG: hypothetical protein U0670_23465 [Anaerolineae bacterium]